jgi:hypothetical protein
MRYVVLMRNLETGTASEVDTGNRRLAEKIALRAERREDVIAGVVGRVDGRARP